MDVCMDVWMYVWMHTYNITAKNYYEICIISIFKEKLIVKIEVSHKNKLNSSYN